MRIARLVAYHVRLRLKRPFSHASHVRHDSENFLVRCELADGTSGWGEGVPREYVTGETPATCFEQLEATPLSDQLVTDCNSWQEVIELAERFKPPVDDARGCASNALRCAVELSMFDAFGKLVGEPISAIARQFEPAARVVTSLGKVRYSTVIGSGPCVRWKALKMRLYGFTQCKVKVGASGDDAARLAQIRRWIGPSVDLRLDANEAWPAAQCAEKLESIAPFNISSIEQPCPHEELDALAAVKPELAIPIMLDESLTSEQDGNRAIELGACDLFNIRLSKCGGFLASLRLAALAEKAGLGYQLGCHPGESGILSAAGRHWACSVKDIAYLEGSYDRHLFKRLLTHEDLTFGYGGVAQAIEVPGLGVSINEKVLDEVTLRKETFKVT